MTKSGTRSRYISTYSILFQLVILLIFNSLHYDVRVEAASLSNRYINAPASTSFASSSSLKHRHAKSKAIVNGESSESKSARQKDKGMRTGQFTFSTNKIYFTRIREYVTMRTLSHRVRYALHRKEIGGDLSFPPSARTRKREKTCGLTQQRLDGICGLVAASVE